MKTRWLILTVVLLPTFSLPGGISVRNPAIRNPVGIGTSPVSSYRNGMVNTGTPSDATADLAITGNLLDGNCFRGNGPYRSALDFNPNPSSSSIDPHPGAPLLNSFLRDSAGSEDLGVDSGTDYAARSYLSPTKAAARTVPGRKRVLSPWSPYSGYGTGQKGNSAANRFHAMEASPKAHVTTEQETTASATASRRLQIQYGGLNNTRTTSERTYSRGSSPGLQDTKRPTPGQADTERRQNDRLALEYREALGRIKQQLDELSRSVESRLKTSPSLVQKAKSVGDAEGACNARSEVPSPAPQAGEMSNPELVESSYRLEMRDPSFGHEKLGTTAKNRPTSLADGIGQNRLQYSNISGLRPANGIRELPGDIADLSRADMSRQANGIVAGPKKYSSFAAGKFSRHVQDAESYLRAGKYYKAADSFTLALIYSGDNPQALVGKCHALFAAGEYVSSASFLAKALRVNPEYARVEADFVTLLGGSNKLTRRIADIERWFTRSGSDRLQLLLGYVYYNTGRIGEARRVIEAAGEKMPESPAVGAIISAISDAELSR